MFGRVEAGARVLAYGPLDSRKSAYVRELACRMAQTFRRPPEVIEASAASILAEAWQPQKDRWRGCNRGPPDGAVLRASWWSTNSTVAQTIRDNSSVDWPRREGARAQVRVAVKRILRKFGYPPDLSSDAVKNVLAQTERFAARATAI